MMMMVMMTMTTMTTTTMMSFLPRSIDFYATQEWDEFGGFPCLPHRQNKLWLSRVAVAWGQFKPASIHLQGTEHTITPLHPIYANMAVSRRRLNFSKTMIFPGLIAALWWKNCIICLPIITSRTRNSCKHLIPSLKKINFYNKNLFNCSASDNHLISVNLLVAVQ